MLPRAIQPASGRAEISRRPLQAPLVASPVMWEGERGQGLTAWLSASPCRVSTPFTWSVLQHRRVRAAPAAAPSYHPALPERCSWLSLDDPTCPKAHLLHIRAEINLQGRALAMSPLLEGIPGVLPPKEPHSHLIPTFHSSLGLPTAAQDEILLLGRPLGA